MPFKSESQRRWMYANEPEMAERWEAETPTDAKLPDRVADAKRRDEQRKRAAKALARMRKGA